MSKFVPQVPTYLSELRNDESTKSLIKRFSMTEKEWLRRTLSFIGIQEQVLLINEYNWELKRKPFFNLHQSVIDCISNTTLDIKPCQIPTSVIHDMKTLAVKLPVDCKCVPLSGVTHFMICIAEHGVKTTSDVVDLSMVESKGLMIGYHTEKGVFCFSCPWGKTFKECDSEYRTFQNIEGSTGAQRHSFIARLAIGVMMLASDPDYIDPILLARDKGKTLNEEQHAKAVDRAKRNGVFGFDIGARLEVSPHMRRPHFAIRWTGKNAAIPKLVPVKASIVNKRKYTEVPTGYEITAEVN